MAYYRLPEFCFKLYSILYILVDLQVPTRKQLGVPKPKKKKNV